jgi:hypothetical protein
MIDVARPAFLWAGIALAGIPLLLHFIRPRQRIERVLPTARFLTRDDRTRLRLRRRPDELLLLALRMGLCGVLGAIFSGMSWVGPSTGTGTIVVVAAPSSQELDWEALRDTALDGLDHPAVEVALVRSGEGPFPQVHWMGGGGEGSPATFDSLALSDPQPGATGETVRLAHLLRAVRDGAGRVTGVDSLRARIVAVPRWSGWSAGLLQLKEELWPGAVELRVPTGLDAGLDVGEVFPVVLLTAPEEARGVLAAALRVLGAQLVPTWENGETEGAPLAHGLDAPAELEGTTGIPVELAVGDRDLPSDLWEPADFRPSPGQASSPGRGAVDAFLLLDGRTVPGAGWAPGGIPGPESEVPLLRAGGRPAAASSRKEGACRVVLPMAPHAPLLGGGGPDGGDAAAHGGELALVLESLLVEGCRLPPAPWGVPFDSGQDAGAASEQRDPDRIGAWAAWEDLLGEGTSAPALEAGPLRYPDAGHPLTRILLALAVVLALVEVWRARRSDQIRRESPPTGDRPMNRGPVVGEPAGNQQGVPK